MKIGVSAKLYLALLVAAISAAPHANAQAQQAAPHPLEAEYKNLATIHRALSACPNLIEEWELQEISSRKMSVKVHLERLTKKDLPADYQRNAIMDAAGADCDSPQVQSLAKDVRRGSQIYWLARYQVVSNTSACMEILHQTPGMPDEVEAFSRRVETLLGDALETRDQIEQEALNLKDQIIMSCKGTLGNKTEGSFVPSIENVSAVMEPIYDARRRAKDEQVERWFDLNKGWTMGVGDTVKPGSRHRRTSVLAVRADKPEISDDITGRVFVDEVACGDYAPYDETASNGRRCSLVVDREGGIGITTPLATTAIEYKGDAILRIYNPQDGSVVLSLNPTKRSDVAIVYQLKADNITYFQNVIDQIKPMHPLMQLNVSLIDENGEKMSFVMDDDTPAVPRTVSVGDVRQAHAFAYVSKADDLTLNGITKSIYQARLQELRADSEK